MAIQSKKEPIILFLGDVFILYLSLFLMLLINFLRIPEEWLFIEHLTAFSILFLVWLFIFFIAGLYEKHTILFKDRLPSIISKAQAINTFIAVLFFYLIPYFAITPKTNLFIYLIVSFSLILIWRIFGHILLGGGRKEPSLIIGGSLETKELANEVNNNTRYNLFFTSIVDPEKSPANLLQEIIREINNKNISSIVLNLKDERIKSVIPDLHKLIYQGIEFVDKNKMYEEIFDRMPISLLSYDWLLENLSFSPKFAFDFFKRATDIIIAIFLGIFVLIIYPLVVVAIKFESFYGPGIIVQERIGKNSKLIKVYKFRTMQKEDRGDEVKNSQNQITRVGKFLRKTRVDEFPQLWNVLKGDLSLIGPRPELPSLAEEYSREIPYYNIRHLIKPGLSGWAQIYHDNHPHHGTDVGETKNKLSYDIYYIKNRSIILDLKIALKTIKTLLSRSGA